MYFHEYNSLHFVKRVKNIPKFIEIAYNSIGKYLSETVIIPLQFAQGLHFQKIEVKRFQIQYIWIQPCCLPVVNTSIPVGDTECSLIWKTGIQIEVPMRMDKLNEPRSPYSLSHPFVPSWCHLQKVSEFMYEYWMWLNPGTNKKGIEHYHPLKEWLDALGLVGIVPQTELFPRSWKQKLTPSTNQLIQENARFTVQLQFIPMFTWRQ